MEGGEGGDSDRRARSKRTISRRRTDEGLLGVYRFCHGSVDTPTTGVDTVLQTQGKMMKKWSSGIDTGSSSVDTSPNSQRSQLTGLYCVSTQPQVVSTLDPGPSMVTGEGAPALPMDVDPMEGPGEEEPAAPKK
ncbi:hypothetical protein Taro_019032, partial [Colocasia esculenta]|nr:hypothetical protein [Colocasia esculenta]